MSPAGAHRDGIVADALAGTVRLTRLALRRDRLRLAIWILSMGILTYATASAFRELYPTVESRTAFATTLENTPALVALTGPPFDLRTVGGLTAWRIGGFGAVLMALLGIFTTVRHSRAEEEAGRLELLRAGPIGRFAPLTAALWVALGATAVVGAMVATGLLALGEDAAGALALALGFTASGWLFAAVAAAAAQLTATAGVANGIAGGLVGLAFALRAIGDSASGPGPRWLSWLSPIGWSQRLRPFAGERWEVLGLFLAATVLLAGAAYLLASRRDMGAGLLPPRPGPARAKPHLGTPLGLAWRLQRGNLAGWAAGLGLMGTMLGTIAEAIGSLLDDNPQLKAIFEAMGGEQNLVDAFFASTMGIVGLLAGAYAVQSTLYLRSEEVKLRAELVLATTATRTTWLGSHLAVSCAGAALLLAVGGLATGVVHGLRTGNVAEPVGKLLAGGLVQLPAVLVLAAFAVLLFGVVPRWAAAAWGAVAFSAVLAQLGPILRLDQWVVNLSPYTHTPLIPGEPFRVAPMVGLTGVACALGSVGLGAFRRRDIG